MAKQPSYWPLEPSSFFADGRSARPLEPGVVPRGRPLDSDPVMTGLRTDRPRTDTPSSVDNYVNAFPFQVTEADLRRGQQRYTIFCAVCHDPLGTGHGKIVERGYLRPPSYLDDDSRGFAVWGLRVPLREAPVGYFFEVVSKGYGAMPDYASQVPPEDRWRIIAYIRVLQLSQRARVQELPEAERRAALKELGGQP
jgi:mono/diheme cytochrome c family protein